MQGNNYKTATPLKSSNVLIVIIIYYTLSGYSCEASGGFFYPVDAKQPYTYNGGPLKGFLLLQLYNIILLSYNTLFVFGAHEEHTAASYIYTLLVFRSAIYTSRVYIRPRGPGSPSRLVSSRRRRGCCYRWVHTDDNMYIYGLGSPPAFYDYRSRSLGEIQLVIHGRTDANEILTPLASLLLLHSPVYSSAAVLLPPLPSLPPPPPPLPSSLLLLILHRIADGILSRYILPVISSTPAHQSHR